MELNYLNMAANVYVQSAFNQSVFLSSQFSPLDFYLQESTGYLDLAIPSPRPDQMNPGMAENNRRTPGHIDPSPLGRNWKTFLRKQVQSVLPVPIREFFLGERTDKIRRIAGLCNKVLEYDKHRLETFKATHQLITNSFFVDFEGELFDGIADKEDTVKMRHVSKYLRAYEVFKTNRFTFIYATLLTLCIPLSRELTLDVLRTLCDTKSKKLHMFNYVSNERNLITLICHAQAERFDFWGLWNGSEPLALEFDFIHQFRNQEYSRILLKFGFPYLSNLDENSYRWCFLQYHMFDEEIPVVRTVQPLIEKARGGQRTRMMLIMDTFIIFGDFTETGDIDDYVRTLVYLTRSLPEAYVTPSELYSTMQEVVSPEFMPSLQAIVHKYAVAAIFENEYETYSPRRLLHFCRVAIRKRLASNFKLLDGIEDLVIPAELKSYLKLES